MPLYECFVEEGTLTADQKAGVAAGITRAHCAATGAPESFVNVVFPAVPRGDFFVGGQPSAAARMRGNIRAGRSAEVKARLLADLTEAWTAATGLSSENLTVSLVEIAAKDTMKAGRLSPEPGEEAEWLAGAGRR